MDGIFNLFYLFYYAGVIVKIIPNLRRPFDDSHIKTVDDFFGDRVGIIEDVDIQDFCIALQYLDGLFNCQRSTVVP